ACAASDAGMILYPREDVNNDGALMGVCVKRCNIFDPANNTCPTFGSTPGVCVPTSADGRLAVSPDGTGICVAQQMTVARLGEACAETDPFHGAACVA